MARNFLTAVNFNKIPTVGLVAENSATPPATPVAGQLYFDTTGGDVTLYWYDGSAWVAAKGGAGTTLGTSTGASAVGDTQAPGISTDASRSDHRHSREAFGASTSETAFGTAKADGSALTVAHSDHGHGNPTHDGAAHSAISLTSLSVPTADRAMGGFKVTNVATPTVGTDATTKDYVDNLVAGLSWKASVRCASTAQRALSGLTAIDGVTPIANDRVLLKNQTAPAENGIWLAQSAAWTRALDADVAAELEGATVFVEEGGQADTAWTMTTNAPITLGTTGLVWVQFGAGTAYTAGNGLTLTTSTFDVVTADASIVVAADSIRVGFAGNGSAVTAAKSDHNHDATYTKLVAQDCAAATTTTVTHNFNTRDVKVEVYRTTTPWDTVDVDVERPDVNSVLVRFAVAPAAAAFRIVVEGIDQ